MPLRLPTVHDIKGKTVLVRVDFNVPLSQDKGHIKVEDDSRLRASIQTINFLRENQAKVVLISHLGRPDGKPNPKFSLDPVATHLSHLLKHPVKFGPDCQGETARAAVAALQPGEILLLENLRFYPDEEANDATFSKNLAQLADVYVNEAFSAAHRAHASTVGVTQFLPSFAGFALHQEVETLSDLMTKPARPFVMVIGGAKISDKVAAVEHLTQIADVVLVGGGVANNFLKAEGFEVARSYLQDSPVDAAKKGISYVEVAADLIEATKQNRLLLDGYIPLPKILYPIDVVAASSIAAETTEIIDLTHETLTGAEKRKLMFLDIGPKTIRLFKQIIMEAGTVFWNGPMGVFEEAAFEQGTAEVAHAIAKSPATTILGGGDTIAAINQFKLQDRFDYVSAAGGASLEFLSGKKLPGILPLEKK